MFLVNLKTGFEIHFVSNSDAFSKESVVADWLKKVAFKSIILNVCVIHYMHIK